MVNIEFLPKDINVNQYFGGTSFNRFEIEEWLRYLVFYLQENGNDWTFDKAEYDKKKRSSNFDPDVHIRQMLEVKMIEPAGEGKYKLTLKSLAALEGFQIAK
jgi:hypothetical protein